MCSKLTRFSRISFSYMNMTMSLSSAWMQAMPPAAATTFSASQMWPCGTMRPRFPGRMLVVKIFMLAWPSCMASASWPKCGVGTSPISVRWKP